jgi:hypothetical protein
MRVSGLTFKLSVSMAFSIEPSPAQPAKKIIAAIATKDAEVRSILRIVFVYEIIRTKLG